MTRGEQDLTLVTLITHLDVLEGDGHGADFLSFTRKGVFTFYLVTTTLFVVFRSDGCYSHRVNHKIPFYPSSPSSFDRPFDRPTD